MQFLRFPFFLLAVAVSAPVFSLAVHAQGAGAPSFPRSEKYLLGPGDVLRVTVAGFPEFSLDSLTVPPDGGVTIARIGSIRFSGRTRASVQAEIRQRLITRVRLRDPQIAVTLVTPRSGLVGSVIVSGPDVPRGGNIPLREGQRLSGLLAEIGLSDRLEERRATLVRGQASFDLDLNAAATRPGSAADVRLRAGDSIAVRSVAPGKITLGGDVERPGVYELHLKPRPELSELDLAPRLSDLLTRAGGLRTLDDSSGGSFAPTGTSGTGSAGTAPSASAGTPDGTDALSPVPAIPSFPSRVPVSPGSSNSPRVRSSYSATLQRGGEKDALDVEAALNNVAGAENIVLRSGDFISIRLLRPITVFVDGATTKTGSFQVAPGAGVLELLTLAGPLTRSAGDLKAAIRRGNDTIPLDLPELLLSSQSGANLSLQDRDIVQLREPETVGVSVAGQVARPGDIKVRPGATIYQAILAVGGIAAGVPLENARLNVLRRETDGTQRVYAANAAGIFNLTDVSTNLILHEGDIVNVARGEDQTVFVSGEVVNPNSFQVLPNEGLAQIIARAGGPKDDAGLTRVRVTRRLGGKVEVVDAFDAVKNGRPLPFALQAGDIVNVPVNPDQVLAVQAFAKPGYIAIPERGQLRLLDFLGQAQPLPGVKRLFILKAQPDGVINPKLSPTTTINIDALRTGKQANITLSPRDVIFAEPAKSKKSLLDLLGPLSVLRFAF